MQTVDEDGLHVSYLGYPKKVRVLFQATSQIYLEIM